MVFKAVSRMESGKATGPSGIIVEMIKAAGDEFIDCLTSLFNQIIYDAGVPSEWHLSYISRSPSRISAQSSSLFDCHGSSVT